MFSWPSFFRFQGKNKSKIKNLRIKESGFGGCIREYDTGIQVRYRYCLQAVEWLEVPVPKMTFQACRGETISLADWTEKALLSLYHQHRASPSILRNLAYIGKLNFPP
jgi:hypothetical protein